MFKKIILNNFSIVYFILLNVVLAIKMTTKYNDSLSEYFVFGFFIYCSLLIFKYENVNIKKVKRFTFFNFFLSLISISLLLLLNYKSYVTNIFIIKYFLFSIICIFFVYVWVFLSYKYYKKKICFININLHVFIATNKGDISILDVIFSVLSWIYIMFGAIVSLI